MADERYSQLTVRYKLGFMSAAGPGSDGGMTDKTGETAGALAECRIL